MRQFEVAVIGTGWCGGIRAETLSLSALVDKLHICKIRPDRLDEVKEQTNPSSATLDYMEIINKPAIEAGKLFSGRYFRRNKRTRNLASFKSLFVYLA